MDKFSHTPGREIAKDRSDWLLDAIAGATQDRRFLRGDPAYDEVVGEVILLNAEKAISVALDRAGSMDALRFYADPEHWSADGTFLPASPLSEFRPDTGDTARAAIAMAMGDKS